MAENTALPPVTQILSHHTKDTTDSDTSPNLAFRQRSCINLGKVRHHLYLPVTLWTRYKSLHLQNEPCVNKAIELLHKLRHELMEEQPTMTAGDKQQLTTKEGRTSTVMWGDEEAEEKSSNDQMTEHSLCIKGDSHTCTCTSC